MQSTLKTGAPLRMAMSESDVPKCEFCKFWLELPSPREKNPDGSRAVRFGLCRRYPPTMLGKPLIAPNGRPAQGPDLQPVVNPFPVWPILGDLEWCGEFAAGVTPGPARQ